MTQNNIIVFYHKNCVDGTAAAAVLLRKFPEAKTVPLNFGELENNFDDAKNNITPETQIYFVDTAFRLEEMIGLGKSIVVIDHHISEKARIERIANENENITYIFDNDESGSTLAFKYLFPEEMVPDFLKYVKDIDLWQKKFTPESEWLHQYLSTKRNFPELLLPLFNLDNNLESFLASGKVLFDYVDLEVEMVTKISPLNVKIGDYLVPAFNITNHQSKSGNILSLKFNSVVILYSILGDKTRFSIRSFSGCVPNAREIAETIEGGGGHDHAAGATVNTTDFLTSIQI
jgi:oligoribonuclease NrnB/cAMP/cGMP phosphodiesterase (DHH superfamily)